jgi:thiamine biosynthesis lipoprotein
VATLAPQTDGVIYRTSAWSTRVALVISDRASMVAAIAILHRELDRIDAVASRFRADSELTHLHGEARAGHPVDVSSDLLEAIGVALRAAALSDGAVDPTVGQAMSRIGYDRDFEQIVSRRSTRFPNACPVPGWQSVELDTERSTVRLSPGTKLDLGATAKALASDRAAHAITDQLGCAALVSLGGDVSVTGEPMTRFDIGISEVFTDGPCPVNVALGPGGLATSGTGARRWLLGGRTVHHIVDPTTGLPVESCWRTVSVVAGSCVDANIASTASVIKGPAAPGWLEALGLPARLVRLDGHAVTVAGWPSDPDENADVGLRRMRA